MAFGHVSRGFLPTDAKSCNVAKQRWVKTARQGSRALLLQQMKEIPGKDAPVTHSTD
jgi:hypothetical protein